MDKASILSRHVEVLESAIAACIEDHQYYELASLSQCLTNCLNLEAGLKDRGHLERRAITESVTA